ncbi:hypothetical protein GCM10009718_37030 [Isoptericola halotolerans]|uniref:Uncharacterized protein n=1 Tax=Isoptericola halotolerans TaxID=300560 RepID=A0ABX2A970_9MICO|nr:hypothetical protein [Isoptericola halotolerans]NOV98233.1 hypothetical protein [Isoptericola halotolerans]
MICPPCDLDGPCDAADCEARDPGVYRCASCTAPFPSAAAARRCAEIDESPGFTD